MRSLIVLFVLAACGGSEPERNPPPVEPTMGGEIPIVTNTQTVPANPPGSTFENPVPTCGAREGYQFVADQRCPDGSMPLGGDAMSGARARVGSMGSHQESGDPMNSHIVDHYQLQCPSGAIDIYVCMYHCAAGRTPFE